MEVWKYIPDYEGVYQVSNLGKIRSLRFNKIKIISQKIRKDGYYEVSIYKNKKVSKIKSTGKYKSQITINGKLNYLGVFTDKYEASRAYQEALKNIND